MILETQRLILREYVEQDWEYVHAYASDADIVKFMDFGPNSVDDTKGFIQAMIAGQTRTPRQSYEFAITLKPDGVFIGGCGLGLERNHQASLGYCLNRPYWGLGYATEAAMALCKFGFGELELHRIFATCRPENVASARVMQKVGMQREGLLRENIFAKNKWQDSLLYAVLVHEFAGWNSEGRESHSPSVNPSV